MKTVTFYATHQELVSWVEEWRLQFGLYVGVVAFQPRRQLIPLQKGERLDAVWKPQDVEGSNIEELWLNLEPLNPNGLDSADLARNNQDRLEIGLPKTRGSTIKEADVGTVSEEPEHLRVWKRIVADLKRKTDSGMWVVGGTGVKGFHKDMLFSRGIAEMVKQGVQLTTLTGLPVSIEEPQL